MLVARYGGTPELAARVEAAVRTQQNNDTAVAMGQAAAAILERVVVEVRPPGRLGLGARGPMVAWGVRHAVLAWDGWREAAPSTYTTSTTQAGAATQAPPWVAQPA